MDLGFFFGMGMILHIAFISQNSGLMGCEAFWVGAPLHSVKSCSTRSGIMSWQSLVGSNK